VITAAAAWRRTLVASVVITALLIGLFWSTVSTMLTIWLNIETYSHGFLILPISLWLAWRRRDILLATAPSPAPWVLLLCLATGAGWGLSHLLGVQVVEQLALIALWVTALWALLGHRAARLLAFPLLFLFLMVPMGDGLVPSMMDFTADFTVWMLELTGIPVYREGLYFVIPSGNWSVVEACSGVRYLIASVTLGLLYAYLTYRSLWRRALFVLLAILVPILANGVRAYMIVMIGHLSNMQLAVGVDHLIYGWIFFGLVMLLLFWLGSLWVERDAAPLAVPVPAVEHAHVGLGSTVAVLVGAVLVSLAVRAGVNDLAAASLQMRVLQLPPLAGNWQRHDPPRIQWPLQLKGPDQTLRVGYGKGGDEVALVLGVFHQQQQGAEVVSSENVVLKRDAAGWRITGHARLLLPLEGDEQSVPVYQLKQQQTYLLGESDQRLLVASWYRLGSRSTANEYIGKWYQALALLGEGRSDGAFVMLATEDDAEAPERLRTFAREALPELLVTLDASQAR